ncbi:MAG: phosphotriesterase [Cytophagales bacterium]|jgi:phosphotriesterase-related protein|nr:phosphotriesterase [Cytophagales bacterium]
MYRRTFLQTAAALGGAIAGVASFRPSVPEILTVTGPRPTAQMGLTLIHEHLLVDFIGADQYNPNRWSRAQVVRKVLPYLREVKALGCQTLLDCTPAYLGRDPLLLKMLSQGSGVQILTNTGYYGAVQNKFLPPHAFTETADQLAARWTREFKRGIDDTGIRPGFMKISVEPGHLSDLHRKLITAAARTHRRTGLTICSHTGFAIPAFEQMEVLKQEGVRPDAFVWVHAHNERNKERYPEAAKLGTWVSLDGLADDNVDEYLLMLRFMKDRGVWHRTLVSHDAGWYKPGEPDGGTFRPFTTLFQKLLPKMRENGFSEDEIKQLLVTNPAEAFAIRRRVVVG